MQAGTYNSRAIMVVGVTLLGLLGAVFLGRAVAIGDFKIILFGFVASIAMAIGLSLGKNYWMLIPATFFASGSIGALPIPFNYQEIGIIGAFGLFAIHLCFKKQHFGYSMSIVDVLIWLNIAYLVSVFIRNPAGFLAFRTELVGGRAYFTIVMVVMAYLVLCRASVNDRMARKMPFILAAAMLIPSSLGAITELVPQTARVIYPFYTAINIEDFSLGISGGGETDPEERLTSLAAFARPLVLLLCSLYPPITLISPLYMGRMLIFSGAVVLAGLSGFRNLFAAIGAFMVIGSAVRKKVRDIFLIVGVGLAGIVLLSAAYTAGMPVPFTLQRALSFVPVEWDPAAIRNASATSDWRFEMWKDAWTRPGHMRSKTFGDGFGYTFQEMMIFSDELRGIGGFLNSSTYEAHLIRGSYHSGPLSTIKRVGFVGGIFLLALMVAMAVQAVKVINRARNTPFFVWSLFVGIPLIYYPFEFIFIFGDYTNAMTDFLFAAGMLKVIENSMSLRKEKDVAVPLVESARPAPAGVV